MHKTGPAISSKEPLSIKNNDSVLFEVWLINLVFLLFIFRAAVPFFKYPFFLCVIILGGFVMVKYRKLKISLIISSFRCYKIPILLFLIILLQFVLTEKIYLTIFKDLISSSLLLSVFFILYVIIDTEKKLKIYLDNLLLLIVVFALLISFFNFFVIFDILAFRDFAPFNLDFIGQKGETLDIDNNFASIPIFFGLIALLFLRKIPLTKAGETVVISLFVFFLMNIILSASKRGIILLFVLVIVAAGILLFRYLKIFGVNSSRKDFGNGAGKLLFSLLLLAVLSGSFLFLTDYRFKSRLLHSLGSRNTSGAFQLVTSNILEYTQVINLDLSFSDLYRLMWNPLNDPFDPDSGWGTRVHKTVDKLTGPNVEIVPAGSKGYMLDNTCNASVREGNAYAFTLVNSENAIKEEVTGATVYCYVSEDFDGYYAMIAYEAEGKDYQRVSYDMSKKGTWQKLSLNFTYKNGEFPAYFYIAKFGETNFSSLKGFVIFAHPVINQTEKPENSASQAMLFDNKPDSWFHESQFNDYLLSLRDKSCFMPSDLNANRVNKLPFLNIRNQDLVNKGSFFPGYIQAVNRPIFVNMILQSDAVLIKTHADRDPFRSFISKLVDEDSTYYPPGKMKIQSSGEASTGFIQMRVQRWKFAGKIFFQEYNPFEKIFGGGFSFINWYGDRFLGDRTKSDWPHNPFLSVLLYSGIIGLSLYIFFVYRVFLYYFKYLTGNPEFFIFFLVTLYFSFFSAGGPFDPPVSGFFVLLPFFINGVYSRLSIVNPNQNERE